MAWGLKLLKHFCIRQGSRVRGEPLTSVPSPFSWRYLIKLASTGVHSTCYWQHRFVFTQPQASKIKCVCVCFRFLSGEREESFHCVSLKEQQEVFKG